MATTYPANTNSDKHTMFRVGSIKILEGLLLVSLFCGCASTGGNVPVTAPNKSAGASESQSTKSNQGQKISRTAQTRPGQTKPAPPKSSAAQTLLAQANTALASNEPRTAVVLLERAVRIEPREALLWIRLSKAHLQQGDTQVAFQHARKAIALAGSDSRKQTAAWLQLADVYQAQGRRSDAKNIRQRYKRGSG